MTLAPDFKAHLQDLKAKGVPLLGAVIIPSKPGLRLTHPGAPVGFTSYSNFVMAAHVAGIPHNMLRGPRRKIDAFRCAVATVKRQKWFRKHYRIEELKGTDCPTYCVMGNKAKNIAQNYLLQESEQAVYWKPDDPDALFSQGRNIIGAEVNRLFPLFQTHLTHNEVTQNLTDLIRTHCRGVSLRNGGGAYYVPYLSGASFLNDQWDQVQEFSNALRSLGEPSLLFTEIAVTAYDALTQQIRGEVERDLRSRQGGVEELTKQIAAMREKAEQKVGQFAQDGHVPRSCTTKLRELGELEQQCEMLESVLGTRMTDIHETLNYLRNTVSALMHGLPLPKKPGPRMVDKLFDPDSTLGDLLDLESLDQEDDVERLFGAPVIPEEAIPA